MAMRGRGRIFCGPGYCRLVVGSIANLEFLDCLLTQRAVNVNPQVMVPRQEFLRDIRVPLPCLATYAGKLSGELFYNGSKESSKED